MFQSGRVDGRRFTYEKSALSSRCGSVPASILMQDIHNLILKNF